MRKILLYLILLVKITCSFSQTNLDHKEYVDKLNNAKELLYKKHLDLFDKSIQKDRRNITLKIERCEYIYYSYYDEYEGYSLKYDEYLECLNSLYSDFPTHPKVVLKKIENTYGDSLQIYLEKAEKLASESNYDWHDYDKSSLYHTIARNKYNDENYFSALQYLKIARRFKDTVDNSLLAADIYIANELKEKALSVISEKISSRNETWQLNRKAQILLDLNAPKKALEAYKMVEERDSSFVDNSKLSKTFENLKEYDVARDYLAKDTVFEWKREEVKLEIANFDLKYSEGKVALESYRDAHEDSYYDDFWGIKRLKLFFKAPQLNWNFYELSHIVVLFLSILVLFILPYLVILPIQFLGNRLNWKPKKIKIPFNWNLKDFWLIVFVYLLVDFFGLLIYDYQGLINSYFSDSYVEESAVNVSSNIFFFTMLFIGTLVFLNKTRLKYLWISKLPLLRVISLFVFFMGVNIILNKLVNSFDLAICPFTMREELKEIITNYGFGIAFLFVVVLVPIYEEIIFRGIILSSVEKHLGFWKANLIQAILFALAHLNFQFLPVYIAFAMIIGLIVKQSQGLRTGILFHAANNFLFLIALYFTIR